MYSSRHRCWQLSIAVALGMSGAIGFSGNCAFAQVTADPSLGTKVSVNGATFQIRGGTTVGGTNLFHSFSSFSVPSGGTANFLNTPTITNILARVTGSTPSDIQGLIHSQGSANLFLMNPNGILFGSNAQLNIGGSFVGTTANAIAFPGGGVFSLTSAVAPGNPLLKVNPSALLFNQISPGAIANNSIAPAGLSPSGSDVIGLRVPDGKSLLLVGGDVRLDGGRLNALGGRIELGGLTEPGTVGLQVNGNTLSLNFAPNNPLSNVTLADDARVSVTGVGGGNIIVYANNFTATDGGRLVAGTEGTGNAGDITVNTNDFKISGVGLSGIESGIRNQVLDNASGNAGNIFVNTKTYDASADATVVSSTASGSFGNAGDIFINTRSFTLSSAYIASNTFGSGNAGNVRIVSSDSVELTDGRIQTVANNPAIGDAGNIFITTGAFTASGAKSYLYSGTLNGGRNSGNVTLIADSVRLLNGSYIDSSTIGASGNAGRVEINANSLTLENSSYINTVNLDAGKAGDIFINAGNVSFLRGSRLNSSSYGTGDAGNVTMRVRDSVSLAGKHTTIFSNVEAGGVGSGGNIDIKAGSLSLSDGAQLQATLQDSSQTTPGGRGNAGNVNIDVRETLSLTDFGTIIFSNVGSGAEGNGGNVDIKARSLSLTNEAALFTSTFGQGNAGNISVQTTDSVSLANDASILSSVAPGAVGKGGSIAIQAASLSLTDSARLGVSNLGGRGDSGNIDIQVDSLSLDRTSMSASTSGQGNGGNISIWATDSTSLTNSSAIFSSVLDQGVGKGGDITLKTGSLSLTNGSQLNASTSGHGIGGNVTIEARDTISLSGVSSNGTSNGIFSYVSYKAIGKGGDINIQAGSLSLSDHALLTNGTLGQGNGGNIDIKVGSLALTDAFISSESLGTDKAGDITIQTRENLETNRSQIVATTQAGDGGNIKLQVGDVLLMRNNSKISTTAGQAGAGGNGGNININANFVAAVSNENSDITANAYNGRGGNINITTQGIYGLKYRERETPLSDITASSQFGVNGEFQLDLLTNVDPSRGLAELPTDVVDATRQIDRRCTPRGTAQERSSFTITGRGGLPPSPNDPLQGEAVVTNWVSLDSDRENNTPPAKTKPSSSAPRQLVEAQGWVINEKGQVVLTASSPKVTPQSEWLSPPECNSPRSAKTP